jgi:hypothetical protein
MGPKWAQEAPTETPRDTQEAPKRGQESSQKTEEPTATHQLSPETPKSAQERARRGTRSLTLGLSLLLLGAVLCHLWLLPFICFSQQLRGHRTNSQ